MGRPKGSPKTPGSGRVAGVPNKVNAEMKNIWMQAFERKGGVEYLVTLPDELFVRGLIQITPKEVKAEIEGAVELVIERRGRKGDDD